jgi:cytoskeletal protein RodZ
VEEHCELIGGRLKAAREAAGLTVDDVLFRTRLPRSVVVALEAEDFSVFTSPLYAKSFLFQYSDFLGVDAQPWLDALEPGGFMPGGLLRPLVESPVMPLATRASNGEPRGGWLPVLGLLGLSAALVFSALKSYAFFEERFGGEPHPRVERGVSAAPVPAEIPRVVPMKPAEKLPAIVKEDDELGKPAPRAIIVR